MDRPRKGASGTYKGTGPVRIATDRLEVEGAGWFTKRRSSKRTEERIRSLETKQERLFGDLREALTKWEIDLLSDTMKVIANTCLSYPRSASHTLFQGSPVAWMRP